MKKRRQRSDVHDRRASDLPLNAHVAVMEVDDPLGLRESATQQPALRVGRKPAPGLMEWRAPGIPKIAVIRSIRNDPLAWMQAHGRLAHEEYLAGRHWQAIHARAAVGRIQAIDTSKEPVDGGRLPEMLTDDQQQAIITLKRCEDALDRHGGELRKRLVNDVLAVGMFIAQAAQQRGIGKRRAARLFHSALGILAREFGFAGISSPRPARRSKTPRYSLTEHTSVASHSGRVGNCA